MILSTLATCPNLLSLHATFMTKCLIAIVTPWMLLFVLFSQHLQALIKSVFCITSSSVSWIADLLYNCVNSQAPSMETHNVYCHTNSIGFYLKGILFPFKQEHPTDLGITFETLHVRLDWTEDVPFSHLALF